MGSLNLRPYQAAAIQSLRLCLAGGVEVWAECAGFEGMYEVSSLGKVRSLDRVSSNGSKRKGKVLNPCVAGAGYLFVTLCNSQRSQKYVHRLVAEAFLPNESGRTCVNHKDGNKLNCRLENLEWVSHSENMVHSAHVLGRPLPPAQYGRGEIVPVVGTSEKTGDVVRFRSQSDAARNGFNQQCISDCLFGRQKTHRGYRWEVGQ